MGEVEEVEEVVEEVLLLYIDIILHFKAATFGVPPSISMLPFNLSIIWWMFALPSCNAKGSHIFKYSYELLKQVGTDNKLNDPGDICLFSFTFFKGVATEEEVNVAGGYIEASKWLTSMFKIVLDSNVSDDRLLWFW